MAINAISNFFGAHSQGLGAFGVLGLTSSTVPPQLERYHEEQEWSRSPSKGRKGNVALSALTLLAFLFFLHILQNCIQEHMHEMKGKYKGTNGVNTTINLPNMVVIDSGSTIGGRGNLKGDDGELPSFQEDLGQYPPRENAAKNNGQSKIYKHRSKKNHKRNQQPKKKEYVRQQSQHPNEATPVKNTVPGVAYPLDSPFDDIPMHRIDNIP